MTLNKSLTVRLPNYQPHAYSSPAANIYPATQTELTSAPFVRRKGWWIPPASPP